MDNELRDRLAQLTLWDERRLTRRVEAAERARDERKLAAVEADLVRAEQRVARRRANVPAVSYPPTLPISQARDEIVAAIRDHQVVIVAGETGSGKTTQIPKMCLELGRGVRGAIGHTQPRRLAARTVAERIAEELKVELGGAVGYRVRFGDHAGEDTAVRLMTDGILLAEIQSDRELWRYDTIIIDEAHERSLNVDFILGYLKTPAAVAAPTSRSSSPRPRSTRSGSANILPEANRASRVIGGRIGQARVPEANRCKQSAGGEPGKSERGCADRRGVRPDVPGRGALPAAGRPGPPKRRGERPGAGHLRRAGGLRAEGPRRCPGLPQR